MKDFFCHMWFDIFGYGLSDEGLDRKLIVEAHQESSSAVLCILANYTECVRIRHVHMPLKIPWAGSCKEFSGSGSWAEYIREKIMTYIYHRNTWVWVRDHRLPCVCTFCSLRLPRELTRGVSWVSVSILSQ